MPSEDEFLLYPPASEAAINEVCAALPNLPEDYVSFMRASDGGEGFVGEHYLVLWRITELKPFNGDYELEQYAPGIVLFGSDGGGELYGFDMLDPSFRIVRLPAIGMDRRDALFVAQKFSDLFNALAQNSNN